jgi:superfamily II DNA or RNA helicase
MPKNYLSAYQRMHYGIYTNETRNWLIAEDAERHKDDRVLILVRTVEHGLILRQLLGCPLVYGGLTPARQAVLTGKGLLDEDESLITPQEVQRIKKDFTDGDTKLVIATNIWEEAVDFPELAVVIRTDAQSSAIKCTQICGRPSRLHDEKSKGIIYDYRDEHDDNLRQNARGRAKFYAEMGYTQVDYEPEE